MRAENQAQLAGYSHFIMLNGDSELSLHLEAIGATYYHIPPATLSERIPTKIPRITKNRKRSSSSRDSKSAQRKSKTLVT